MKGQRACSLHSLLVTSVLLALILLIFTTDAASTRRRVVELSAYADISTTVNDEISEGGSNGVTFALTGLNQPSRNIKMPDYILLRETKAIADDCLFVNENRGESFPAIPTHQVLIPEEGETSIVLLAVSEDSVSGFFIDENNSVFNIKQENGSSLKVAPSPPAASRDWTCTALKPENSNAESRNLSEDIPRFLVPLEKVPSSHEDFHSHDDGGQHSHGHSHHHKISSNSDIVAAFEDVKESLRDRTGNSHPERKLYCESLYNPILKCMIAIFTSLTGRDIYLL